MTASPPTWRERASRRVGERSVHPVGHGCGSLGFAASDQDSVGIQTIHAALDAGIVLFDTALAYTNLEEPSHGERLLGEALRSHPAGGGALVATKGGHWRSGESTFPNDGRPETLRHHCESSLASLRVERLALYQLHWPDPDTLFLDSVRGLAALQQEGLITMIGLSNVTTDQLVQAMGVVDVVSVQNHFSPLDETDRAMVDLCADRNIAYLAWSPLGGARATQLATLRPDLQRRAQRARTTVQRTAVAWLLEQSPTLIPLIGAGRPASIRDCAHAADVVRGPS